MVYCKDVIGNMHVSTSPASCEYSASIWTACKKIPWSSQATG